MIRLIHIAFAYPWYINLILIITTGLFACLCAEFDESFGYRSFASYEKEVRK